MKPHIDLLYSELDCLSNYSFLNGASHPEELISRAAELGYKALALCDYASMAGVVRAYAQAKLHPEIRLLVGSRFRFTGGGTISAHKSPRLRQEPATTLRPMSC